MTNFKNPETIGLHGGEYRSDPTTTAVAVPIYQTTLINLKMQKQLLIYLVLKNLEISTPE